MNPKFCAEHYKLDAYGEPKTCCFVLKDKAYTSFVFRLSYNFDMGVNLLIKKYGPNPPFPIENKQIKERITKRDVWRVQQYCWGCDEHRYVLSELVRPPAKNLKEKFERFIQWLNQGWD